MAQLWSFAAQTRRDFSIRVMHDGPPVPEIIEVVESFNAARPEFATTLTFAGHRYNDWGHSMRELGLKSSWSDFMLITNDDNYYAPSFVEKMLAPLEAGADITYCNMIHSHHMRHRDSVFSRKRLLAYRPLVTRPKVNFIDMGAFVFRTELGQSAGFADKTYAADGIFFERMLAARPKVVKVNDYLFVHN